MNLIVLALILRDDSKVGQSIMSMSLSMIFIV